MKIINTDLLIIGAGPAGLATALEGSRLGIKDILIIERNNELGGILQQCIHDGFGIHRFKKQLSGPWYAQMFIDGLEKTNVKVMLNTMVVDVKSDKTTYAINSKEGMIEIFPKAIVLAMGCRERTKNQVFIFGTRPKGIITAGTVQRYINMEGLIPGKKAVILGSGDIGLIMARRMKLEGIEVEGVYEVMDTPGGLQRNVFQCLDDYNIPLHLSTTVTSVKGKYNLEGVVVQKVDKDRNPLEETKRYIPCDLLVLSVGLIPENELSNMAKIPISEVTRGPILNNEMMTEVEGFFAAGNVSNVFDLVDYVSDTGEAAARGAYNYIINKNISNEKVEINPGKNVNFLIPMSYNFNKDIGLNLYFRTRKIIENGKVVLTQDNKVLYEKKHQILRPQEMICVKLKDNDLEKINKTSSIKVDIVEN